MGCSGRVKEADIRPEQKWDFISLNDFKSTSCFTPFAYGYLWISLLISIAVYAVDTFTAVNLLAFNKWSGEIEPVIPLAVSKWIFSACIIASWVNVGFEHLRALRVMKRGAVAESYLDSLAVRLQCVRMGEQGRGWRRFLVFAELTKSKKGAEYVALFTYFAFQSWIRIIFCQGPRQVVNALTLWSVFKAKLDPSGTDGVGNTLLQFFKNIGILADEEHQQAVILSGMVFTLVIWVFGALSLIVAMLFYLFFLWHWIPNKDGGLSGYCERKINGRLSKIVSAKVNKALEDEERKRIKADAKAVKKGEKPQYNRQATLPTFLDQQTDDDPANALMLNRVDTTATLPAYSSRPGTPSGQPTLPAFELDQLNQKRPDPTRNATGSSVMSNASYASNAPLMGNVSEMGYGRSNSPAPSLPPLNTDTYTNAPQRTMTANSNSSQWNRGPPGPPRMPSAMGDRGYSQSPVSYTDNQNAQSGTNVYGRPQPRTASGPRSNTPMGAPSMGRRTPFDQFPAGRQSPGPGSDYGRNSPAPSYRSPTSPTGGYQPYNPQGAPSNFRSASAAPASNSGPGPQYRNMTDPGSRGPNGPQFPRPGTSQSNHFGGANTPDSGHRGSNTSQSIPRPGTAQSNYFAGAPLPNPQRPGTAQSRRGTPNGSMSSIRDGSARLASPAPYQNGNQSFGPGGSGYGPQGPYR